MIPPVSGITMATTSLFIFHHRTTTEYIVMTEAHCENWYKPGQLWRVFPVATKKIPHLFDRNERLVFHIEHFDRGNVQSILAMIGAFGVGRMTTDWNPVITNNHEPQKEDITILQSIQRGDEIGRFELGSTVVLFFQPDQIVNWSVEEGQKVQLGEPIADLGN